MILTIADFSHELYPCVLSLTVVMVLQAVLCRAGEPVILTQTHNVIDDREESSRIFRSDGIITEVFIASG